MNNIFLHCKKNLLCIAAILFCLKTIAQPYKVGDTIRPFAVGSVVGTPGELFNSKDQQGKALILDFWATWCSPCVSYFPKMDSLKKMFARDLVIIAVSYEKQEVVKKFLNTYKKNYGLSVSSISEDKELRKLFPHREIPHYVWINKNGVVAAITKPDQVTEENVRKLIAGESLRLPVKNEHEDLETFKVFHNLVDIDKKRGFPSLITYSYLGGYQRDVNSHFTAPIFEKETETMRIKAINSSLSKLYKIAFFSGDGPHSFHDKRIICKDFTMPVADYISKENLFSFDQIIKGNNVQQSLSRMRKTLDAEFGISSKLDTLMVEAVVLTVAPGYKFNSSSTGPQTIETPDSIIVNNVSIGHQLAIWNGMKPLLPYPIVDETGLEETTRIKIAFPQKRIDYDSIKSSFAKAGFILTKEQRKMPVIVLSRD